MRLFCIIDAVYVGLRISGLTLLDHVSTHIQYTVYTIQYISHNLMVCMQHSLRLVRRDKNWNQLTSGLSRASFNRLSKISTATLNVSESIWFGSDTASATATACSTTGNCREVIITPKLSLIQWNLWARDTMEPTILSLVERLSLPRRSNSNKWCWRKCPL